MEREQKPRGRTTIGPWRLLDIVCATSPWRAGLAAAAILPEHGAPDPRTPNVDPDQELPDSYIGEHEQRQAIARERARRFVRVRGESY